MRTEGEFNQGQFPWRTKSDYSNEIREYTKFAQEVKDKERELLIKLQNSKHVDVKERLKDIAFDIAKHNQTICQPDLYEQLMEEIDIKELDKLFFLDEINKKYGKWPGKYC
jgi:hypothetical protein